MTTLGIIADTHVPERVPSLHPRALEIFQLAQVEAILHAGDVCIPSVLEQLEEVAPVHAVRGNRDWVYLKHLPFSLTLTFEGVTLALTHGHGRWWNYLADRSRYFLEGFRMERYTPRLVRAFPGVKAVVFGHTHRPFNQWIGEQLLFTPGSACCTEEIGDNPSVGLLVIQPDGVIEAKTISLV
jgi:putative phosphoesterase